MANLEEIVASLTDRLRSLEIENQALQQEIRPESIREPKAALPDKFDGTRRHFRGFINQLELGSNYRISGTGIRNQDPCLRQGNQPCAIYAAEFRQLTADIDWNDAALRSQFYSGLSSEIKDHLVHCESPVSLAAAMDQAIRIDNRIFERRQEQQYNPRSFRRNQPLNTAVSRIQPQQYQQQYMNNYSRQSIHQTSAPITSTPVQQHRTTDDMDIDLARRGPLTSQKDNRGLVKDSALFVVSQDTSKPLVPGPTLALGLSDRSKPLKWKAPAMKFRETISADSNSDASVPLDILSSFSSLFSEDQAETLPPHRVFDCSIDLKPASEPFHGKIYQLTSKGPSPGLRLSRSTDSLSSWSLPFGLANAPAQFQRMMNSLFRDCHGKHVLVYLDDIVIYSDNMSDHSAQVQNVLRVLQDNGLYCKAEKCHFYKSENQVSATLSLLMDFEWTHLKSRLFRVGRHQRKSAMTANLTKLFKKDVSFVWGPEQESSFQDLKTAFANSDFLTHLMIPDHLSWRPMQSDYAISGVLSQYDDSNISPSDCLLSRQMNSAEQIMKFTTKSCWLSSSLSKHWRHFLQGGLHPVTVLCDHKNLEYFMHDQEVNSSSGSWSLELSEYDFSLTHRPGKLNGRADSLSPAVKTTSQTPSLQTSSESWILRR
ncbi:hypothetical protein BASA83_006617 [Batrachochytrium salamandrivorans]|nr:hypothetical protein BASA83_006617 [Batrachochytrium salamandrivorans]